MFVNYEEELITLNDLDFKSMILKSKLSIKKKIKGKHITKSFYKFKQNEIRQRHFN